MKHPIEFNICQSVVGDGFDALGLNVENLKRMRFMQVSLRRIGYGFKTVDHVIRGNGHIFIHESQDSSK